jgi:hypothetical protein
MSLILMGDWCSEACPRGSGETTLQQNETAKMARIMIIKRLGEKRAASRRSVVFS